VDWLKIRENTATR